MSRFSGLAIGAILFFTIGFAGGVGLSAHSALSNSESISVVAALQQGAIGGLGLITAIVILFTVVSFLTYITENIPPRY